MKRVLFTDKEVPALGDMNELSTDLLTNISTMLTCLIKKANTIVKGMTVTQSTPTGMSVKVGVDSTDGYGLAISSTGEFIKIDTDQTATISAAHATLDRYDTISIKEVWAASDSATRYIRSGATINPQTLNTKETRGYLITVTAGAPGTPTAPACPSGEIKLAEVKVEALVSTIVNSKITDARSASIWTTEPSTTNYQLLLQDMMTYEDSSGDWVITHNGTVIFRINDAGTITCATLNTTSGVGIFPVGGTTAVFKDLTGCPEPTTASGWAKCNGTTAASQGVSSPTITAILPNINNGAFVRGATSSWTTGGATGGADTHTHTMGNHTHAGTTGSGGVDHTHAAVTSGAGSAH